MCQCADAGPGGLGALESFYLNKVLSVGFDTQARPCFKKEYIFNRELNYEDSQIR